jgi:hypothetical protein
VRRLLLLFAALAACAQTYDAVTDTTVRTPGAAPTVPAAGQKFLEPTYGHRTLRVTDQNVVHEQGGSTADFLTHWGGWANVWAVDSSGILLEDGLGWPFVYTFDPATMTVSEEDQPSCFTNGQFSTVAPNTIFGMAGTRLVRYDRTTDACSDVYNIGQTVTEVAHSRTDKWVCGYHDGGADAARRVTCFNLGTSTVKLLNLTAGTMNGAACAPSNCTTTGGGIHSITFGASDRWMEVIVNGTLNGVNGAHFLHVNWDTNAVYEHPAGSPQINNIGHAAVLRDNVNFVQANGRYDGASDESRSLSLRTLASSTGEHHSAYLMDMPPDCCKWNADSHWGAQPQITFGDSGIIIGTHYKMVPAATQGVWDDEIIGVYPGGDGTVYRFAHHWGTYLGRYTPGEFGIGQASPDGKWYALTSNYGGTLDGGRDDVFVAELGLTGEDPPLDPPSGGAAARLSGAAAIRGAAGIR